MAGVRQFDEGAALDRALKLFWKKGYAATSMQDVAAETGVLRGSLYNAYGDKEALFLRVFDLYRERFLQQARIALEKPKLREALRSLFDYLITSMTTGSPARGCLSTKTALAGSTLDKSVRAVLRKLLDDMEKVIAERLAQPEAGVHLNLPPEQAAQLIVTFTRGAVVIERIYQDKARLEKTAEQLITLLLRQPPT